SSTTRRGRLPRAPRPSGSSAMKAVHHSRIVRGVRGPRLAAVVPSEARHRSVAQEHARVVPAGGYGSHVVHERVHGNPEVRSGPTELAVRVVPGALKHSPAGSSEAAVVVAQARVRVDSEVQIDEAVVARLAPDSAVAELPLRVVAPAPCVQTEAAHAHAR